MKYLKLELINNKEIVIFKQCGYFKVSCFDIDRQKTTYLNPFETYKGAHECFNELIQIQYDKMQYQF